MKRDEFEQWARAQDRKAEGIERPWQVSAQQLADMIYADAPAEGLTKKQFLEKKSNAYACQHQYILFERSLASKLSNTPNIIFISHLQPLQISSKATFYAFFEKFSHLELKPAPTQDEFLYFLQNEFSHSKCFQKAFFT